MALRFAQRPLLKLLSFKITILALLGRLFKRIAYLPLKYSLESVLVKFVAVSRSVKSNLTKFNALRLKFNGEIACQI